MWLYLAAALLTFQTFAWAGEDAPSGDGIAPEEAIQHDIPPAAFILEPEEIELVETDKEGQYASVNPVRVLVSSPALGWKVTCDENDTNLWIGTLANIKPPAGNYAVVENLPVAEGPPIVGDQEFVLAQEFFVRANIDTKSSAGEHGGVLSLKICGEDGRVYHREIRYHCHVPQFLKLWMSGDLNFGSVRPGQSQISSVAQLSIQTNVTNYQIKGWMTNLVDGKTHQSFDASNIQLGWGATPDLARRAAENAASGGSNSFSFNMGGSSQEIFFCAKAQYGGVVPAGNYQGQFTVDASPQ
jgi:hypothetical protein